MLEVIVAQTIEYKTNKYINELLDGEKIQIRIPPQLEKGKIFLIKNNRLGSNRILY
jgi:hypothetical protein